MFKPKVYRKWFDHSLLPDPLFYYSQELSGIKSGLKRQNVRCPFHDDKHPSFSVNLENGSFKCFGCGVSGRDVLAFQMKKYQQNFKEAVDHLDAWGWL